MNTLKETLQQIATDPELHTAYLFILSKMDEDSLETFKNVWPAIPAQRRRDVMQELLDITEVNFEVDFDPVFLLGLADDDAQVRALAIRCLWEHEEVVFIKPLIHLLKADEATTVRAAAASALGKFIYLKELEEIDPNEAGLVEEALLETIYQAAEEAEVRRRAIEAVSFSGDPRIAPIIEAAYFSDNEKMQVSAIFAMGRNADGRWLKTVISELDNPGTEIRFEAARACGELEAKGAVEKLIMIIEQDTDLEVQETAIWALGRIGGETAREALEICVEAENEALAMAAEEALDELNLFDDSLMLYDFSEYADADEIYLEDMIDLDNTNGNSHSQPEDLAL